MAYVGNQPTSSAFLTDTFSGNGSTVAFTMSVAPANTSSILVVVTGVTQDPSTYSVSGTTLTFSAAPPTGTSNISVRYLGIPASGVTTTAYRTITNFTATAGQTTFTPASYTVGYIDVYRNGVRLAAADFTATNGTTIVLANPASAGDSVVTESFYVSSVLNAIPATAGSVNSTYIANGAVGTAQIASSPTLTTPIVATTMGVGGATAANTGSGITFPAAQSASSDVNTLDDYEEGTWTPAYVLTSGSVTYYNQNGTYTKVGNLVNVRFWLRVNTVSSPVAASLSISGLPFASESATTRAASVGRNIAFTGVTGVVGVWIDSSVTTMNLFYDNNGSGGGVAGSSLANACELDMSITYATA